MTTLFIAALWQCASLSTLRSVEYVATNTDRLQAERSAQAACVWDEDPSSYNSCVEMGCREIDGGER